jgi:hypothetical protein
MLQLYSSRAAYVDQFTIYGERHSGTNYLEQCIQQRFGLQLTYFFGFKHFFGWTKPETITYHRMSLHTLFIGIVRDPYQWLMANHEKPHHYDPTRPNDIISFLTGEWYSVQDKLNRDVEIMTDRSFITQQRYKNIFDMRTTKYKYLNETLPLIVPNYVLFSYDTFLKNHENYLNIIQHRFSLKKIGDAPRPRLRKHYSVENQNVKDIIDSNLDWNLENSLGYYKV